MINIRYIFVIFILVVLILFVLSIKNIPDDLIGIEKKNTKISPIPHVHPFKKDCTLEIVYSVEDSQCQNICKQPGTYVSKNNACVNILSYSQDEQKDVCNPKDGVVAYIIGDPEYGDTKLLCLSTDIGIQPDSTTQENRMCQGGGINIDYRQSYPKISDCNCNNDDIKVVVANTSVIRPYVQCSPKSTLRPYELNGLIGSQFTDVW
jgi:hypothetical protein